MRPVIRLFLLAVGALTLEAAAPDDPVDSPSLVARVLKQEIHYSPPSDEPGQPVADSEVLVLPRFDVDDPILGVGQAISAEQRKEAAENFSWRHGGTILKRKGKHVTTEVMFKYDPILDELRLLKFSW